MIPRRILVVDDNPKIHDDFEKILGARPDTRSLDEAEAALFGEPLLAPPPTFRVESTLRGEDAIDRVRGARDGDDPFGVAFVDLRMPAGWDGVRTGSELWAVDPRLQIVFCTAYSDHTWEDLVGTLGVADRFLVLRKPFDTIEVRQLATALWQKWLLEREREAQAEHLEAEVRARTDALAREMAERARLEGELHHAQKLDALGRMAAGLAHEINNPLTIVVANLRMVIDDLEQRAAVQPDGPASLHLASLGDAASATERIARVMRDIATFASHPNGRLGPVEVGPAVEAALGLCRGLLRHGVRLVQRIEKVPPVWAEPLALQQIVVNLVTNAVQALQPSRLAAGRIELIVRAESPGVVVLEVRDNGSGIPREYLGRIFDPFFTTRAVGEGMGLGLSVCRGIVQGFGGQIELESEVGLWTAARVRLRAARREIDRAAGDEPAATGHPRVLLVDDEPAILRVIARGLAQHGIQSVSCDSGAGAIARYREGPFDLVVCDLLMPDVSGMDVYRQLVAMGPEHAARVVFLSGGVVAEEVRAFLGQVRARVLQKPCPIEEIVRLVS